MVVSVHRYGFLLLLVFIFVSRGNRAQKFTQRESTNATRAIRNDVRTISTRDYYSFTFSLIMFSFLFVRAYAHTRRLRSPRKTRTLIHTAFCRLNDARRDNLEKVLSEKISVRDLTLTRVLSDVTVDLRYFSYGLCSKFPYVYFSSSNDTRRKCRRTVSVCSLKQFVETLNVKASIR